MDPIVMGESSPLFSSSLSVLSLQLLALKVEYVSGRESENDREELCVCVCVVCAVERERHAQRVFVRTRGVSVLSPEGT